MAREDTLLVWNPMEEGTLIEERDIEEEEEEEEDEDEGDEEE